MKVQALVALKADYPLPVLLRAAGLARSTFFYHQARLLSPDPQEALKSAITEVFTTNHGRYGHRRIHTELTKQGWTVAKKTVLKLMRALALRCKIRRRKRYNSYQGEQGVIAPNVLDRKFDADAPNQKWVTDVTEFRVGDRKLYLSPVMDLFDRQIISYSIGNSPNLELANTSLSQAITCLEPGQKPLVHSDQGFQYQHVFWRQLLTEAGATQSMSRKGNCYDNAVMENFFGHLKEELFHHVRFLSTDALATALHEYIRWYNNERISTKLEGLSPVQYRAQTLAA
ncbi:IS3 family transposase [Arthrobacter sp. AK01]|uniref:IS3 family transposase n=1 Tax=Micrococcaceae TaxID=1268 RepID=UPI001E60B692|nr:MULTISPECIES: IS3 family transposase [Micrococcaceae]MCD4853772.1 IS3 family transposase [Arthrobacter sp. AK01]MCP1411264.1 putative transposase [Paenarthrobacter sp. A20]MCP1412579.1 putative transposase [Paenarthrobacter sp. A20]